MLAPAKSSWGRRRLLPLRIIGHRRRSTTGLPRAAFQGRTSSPSPPPSSGSVAARAVRVGGSLIMLAGATEGIKAGQEQQHLRPPVTNGRAAVGTPPTIIPVYIFHHTILFFEAVPAGCAGGQAHTDAQDETPRRARVELHRRCWLALTVYSQSHFSVSWRVRCSNRSTV